MPRRDCRKDANHDELSDIGRKLGFTVYDTWQMAQYIPGWPDALWIIPHRDVIMVEYKGKGGKLTEAEAAFHGAYPGPIAIVRDVDDAMRLREKYGR